jgi:hypothetical protein
MNHHLYLLSVAEYRYIVTLNSLGASPAGEHPAAAAAGVMGVAG